MLIGARPFRAAGDVAIQHQGRGLPATAVGASDSRRILARMRRAAQPAGAAARDPPPHQHEYAFLVGPLLDRRTLAAGRGRGAAMRRGHARGAAGVRLDLAGRLCGRPGPPLGVPVSAGMRGSMLAEAADGRSGRPAGRRTGARAACWRAARQRPTSCSAKSQHCASGGSRSCWLRSASSMRRSRRAMQPERIDHAVRGLLEEQPASSAGPRRDLADVGGRHPGRARHRRRCRGSRTRPGRADGADRPAVPVRDAAARWWRCTRRGRPQRRRAPGAAAIARPTPMELPVYTVLVPLLREANVLPDLVRRCARSTIRRQARGLPGARGGRHGDAGGAAGARRCPAISARWSCPTRRRAPSPRP